MASFNKFQIFVQDIGRGVHNLHTNTLKTSLHNTAPVATNSVFADLTEIAAGNGYTAGGTASGSNSYAHTTGTAKLLTADVVFTASGGSIGPFRYPVLYNDTPTSPADPLIGYFDYGSSITLLTGETFTVDYDGSGGTLTIT